jgi:ketosteroid isomerase-like protein
VNRFATILMLFSSSLSLAQGIATGTARKWIAAGNQAWVDGMKRGSADPIAQIYTEDAVDCSSTGECLRGRDAILKHYRERIAKTGRAQSASVQTLGSTEHGRFVYEWGHSQASYSVRDTAGGNYLTVWERQSDGSWNRTKIEAAVRNGEAFLRIQRECGSFDSYCWRFVDGRPRLGRWKATRDVPSTSPESDALSRDLKRRGFSFVGSTVIYAFMQAVGMVNDHLVGCFRHREIQRLNSARREGRR